MEDIIINIVDLNVNNIIKKISLKIKKNQLVTISGPNNSGKTTLIRTLGNEIKNKNIYIKNKNIDDYKIEEINSIIKAVIPLEIIFTENNVEQEIINKTNITKTELKKIATTLKIANLIKKEIKELNTKEIILVQLLKAISSKPEILLLDDFSTFFEENEIKDILIYLKKYQQENNATIIYSTINLKDSLLTDYLYIINDGQIVLEGLPLEILQKDNIINKIGLDLPFMIDLSVKLIDYDLINEIELDMDRMINKLWK